METLYDVLHLNKLDFTDKVNDDDIENLSYVRKILVKEFGNCNVSKLIDVKNLVDNLFISLVIGELQDILFKTDTLRENIFYLNGFMHFVKSRCEPD